MPGDKTTIHVRGACEGDRESLAWLVQRLSGVLLAHAERRLPPALRGFVDPEDLVSSAWLATIPRLHLIEPRNGRYTPPLVKYLVTTIQRLVHTLVKKHRDGESVSLDAADACDEATLSVLRDVVERERDGEVKRAVDLLEPLDGEIVTMRGLEHLPIKHIATVIREKPNTVTKRYRRALGKLRDKLGESVFDDLDEQ